MANYNKVLLMGNLTRDIELKYTQSNQAVANIGLAVSRRFRTQDGQDREETTFIDCEAWGRTAEVMKQYLAKGRPVFIEGRLRLDTWQDKQDGSNRSKLKVVVEGFQFVDSRGGQGGTAPVQVVDSGEPAVSSSPAVRSPASPHQPISSDDIPF
jgi:single-strand DNA-binding protein